MQFAEGEEYDRLRHRIIKHPSNYVFVSIITFHEQTNGWQKYISNAKGTSGLVKGYSNFELLLRFFTSVQLLPFDPKAAEVYFDLKNGGVRVKAMDLRIGSIAIANQMTLITRNSVDFERIPGLSIEDWLV